jgi:hypothetical protein
VLCWAGLEVAPSVASFCGLQTPPGAASTHTARGGTLPELIERPRSWIQRFHPTDACCDAARRLSDVVTLHAIAGSGGRVVLIRLLDGDAVDRFGIYASREEAERFKTHPAQVAIVIPPGGVTAPDAEEILHYHREVYDRIGKRPLEVGYLMPLTREGQRRQLNSLLKAR